MSTKLVLESFMTVNPYHAYGVFYED